MRFTSGLSSRHEQAGRPADVLLATIGRMPVPVFFAFLFLYQLAFIFQGLDLLMKDFMPLFTRKFFMILLPSSTISCIGFPALSADSG